jgi:hypothetical protein
MKDLNRSSQLAFIVAACVGMMATLQPAPTETAEVIDPRRVTARSVSEQFGAELKAALEKALADQGPVGAIAVCRDEAPRIAARLSAENRISVSRTGLRVRNPGNEAQLWQLTVLDSFAERLSAGVAPKELEYFEVHADGSAHFLKAIVTQPLCLVCHGEATSPDVQAALDQYYPWDEATGFKVGELRGAFSIDWPASADSSPSRSSAPD